jgi:hypothetical protein
MMKHHDPIIGTQFWYRWFRPRHSELIAHTTCIQPSYCRIKQNACGTYATSACHYKYLVRCSHGNAWQPLRYSQSQSYVTTDGQSASLPWFQAPPGEQNQISITVSCAFVDMGHPLWREDVCDVYNCCRSSSAQLFSGSSPVGIMTVF